jgi:V-type H+-transporting ATPase subunit C
MSKGTKYLLVSLPTSITPSNHAEEALAALGSTVTSDGGNTSAFAIPNFKIGTLDALVQQADDLSKLNAACEGVVNKVGDSLKTILDGDEAKVQQQKTINDSTSCTNRAFWGNKTHIMLRARRPVPAELPMEQGQVQGRQAHRRADRLVTKGAQCTWSFLGSC